MKIIKEKKRKKKKREHGRGVLHNISEKPRKKGGKHNFRLRMRVPKGTPFGVTRSLPDPVRAASGSCTTLHLRKC